MIFSPALGLSGRLRVEYHVHSVHDRAIWVLVVPELPHEVGDRPLLACWVWCQLRQSNSGVTTHVDVESLRVFLVLLARKTALDHENSCRPQ